MEHEEILDEINSLIIKFCVFNNREGALEGLNDIKAKVEEFEAIIKNSGLE